MDNLVKIVDVYHLGVLFALKAMSCKDVSRLKNLKKHFIAVVFLYKVLIMISIWF